MALSPAEVRSRLESLEGWQGDGDEIRRTFEFKDFKQAMSFVNRIADAAESMDHHPDIDIRYNKVALALSTHSEGGVTDKDFELARKIDAARG